MVLQQNIKSPLMSSIKGTLHEVDHYPSPMYMVARTRRQVCDTYSTSIAISSPTEVVFYVARWHEVNFIFITRDVRKHNEYSRPVCGRDVPVTETCSSCGRNAISYWYMRTKTWALYCIGAVSQNSFRMHLCDAVLSYDFKVQAKSVFPSFSSTENPYNNFSCPEERSQARTSWELRGAVKLLKNCRQENYL